MSQSRHAIWRGIVVGCKTFMLRHELAKAPRSWFGQSASVAVYDSSSITFFYVNLISEAGDRGDTSDCSAAQPCMRLSTAVV